jgi:5-methylthioadenosine/S-adenosylhomocysteine deaminase
VNHVWVDGKMLLKDKQLTTLDTAELHHRATFWQQRIGTTGD